MQLQWRSVFCQPERGSWQLNARTLYGSSSRRSCAGMPNGSHTGYGASLLDDKLRQTSLGLGVSLFEV